jgi:hypothetical protein
VENADFARESETWTATILAAGLPPDPVLVVFCARAAE